MEGIVIWRKDLKPVGKEELERAFAIKWGKEFRVNPKNYNHILALMPQKTVVTLVANAGVSLCEIQVYNGESISRLEWVMPTAVKKSTIHNKDRIPVAFVKSLFEKGLSEKEIKTFFKELYQVISLSQIRAIQENRTKRKYISVKQLKKNVEMVKPVKEKCEQRRRTVEKVGATSLFYAFENEDKTRRLRGSSPRTKNSGSKSGKKIRSK